MNSYRVLNLYKTPSKFYLQPVEKTTEALVIDRQTCNIVVNNLFSVGMLPANATSSLIYGLVGIKHLLHCPYLIVITRAVCLGELAGHAIYRICKTELIPFNTFNMELNDKEAHWNSIYVAMLEKVLQTPHFYFSYTYDLTNSAQRIHSITSTHDLSPETYHQYIDKRFMWNSHVLADFDRCGGQVYKYRLPIILGFVKINQLFDSNKYEHLKLVLISRRSIHRAGTRFNSRGADQDGNVSNFVETEQILLDKTSCEKFMIMSHVQIRGSIPLLWSQRANYRYKPQIEIKRPFDHEIPMFKHFNSLKAIYGKVLLVNLIDQKGHEAALEKEFNERVSHLKKYFDISYHYYDFHKECKGMRYDRLWSLIESIEHEIQSYGYFIKKEDEIIQLQTGVIRSNCIDCLDRTNVIQSMVAKYILDKQLKRLKEICSQSIYSRSVSITPYLDKLFNNVWADNADDLSIQYAGTPALKTDFTRTGERTDIGMVKDGINSLTRYVSNNFLDDFRHDAIELFLGKFEGSPSPLYRPMELISYSSPIQVGVVVLTLILLYFFYRY